MDIAIEKMTEEQAKEWLEKLVNKLNELDNDDFFGTEGWQHFFGLE